MQDAGAAAIFPVESASAAAGRWAGVVASFDASPAAGTAPSLPLHCTQRAAAGWCRLCTLVEPTAVSDATLDLAS